MQSKTMDKKELEAVAKEMAKGVKTEADLAAVTRTMMKTLIETALKTELTEHLGYDEGDPVCWSSESFRRFCTCNQHGDTFSAWHLYSLDAVSSLPSGHSERSSTIGADSHHRLRGMATKPFYAVNVTATIGKCFRFQ